MLSSGTWQPFLLANLAVQDREYPTWIDLYLHRNMPEFVEVGINIEPTGGSSNPISPMLMFSQLNR